MKIKPEHENFQMPVRSTAESAGYDIFMPEAGRYTGGDKVIVPLGFSTEIPKGYFALILPRSGTGFKFGLEVNNTAGVIDADYRGEWMAAIRTKTGEPISWEQGERMLQFVLLPTTVFDLQLVDSLEESERGKGGFGSTGK